MHDMMGISHRKNGAPFSWRMILSAAFIILIVTGCAAGGHTVASDDDRRGSPPVDLVILHTNDTHGHPLKFYYYPAPDVGGLAARATLVAAIRKESQRVLLLDAGDINTGRAESNLFNAVPDIRGFNYIGYDAMAIGNHEFDHAPDILKKQMQQARFPFLSANIRRSDGTPVAQPYLIKDLDGLKVAVFGLTTTETRISANPVNTKDLMFDDEVETARRIVPQLRDKADVVIALTHLGIYPSNDRGSRRLASQVAGIDVIVDGHSHTKLDAPIVIRRSGDDRDTIIVQAWMWGLVLGRLDLSIQGGRVIDYRFASLPVNLRRAEKDAAGRLRLHYEGDRIEEDRDLLALLEPYARKATAALSEVVGTSTKRLSFQEVRSAETALGDLVADALLWHAKPLKADCALVNGGSIRSDIPAGAITKQEIYTTLPFDSTVVLVTVPGKKLQTLFNHIAAIPRGSGGFPQVAGMSFTIDYSTGVCRDIMIGGVPLQPERNYTIVTNSFLSSGGDGYASLKEARDKYDTSLFMRDVVISYIQSNPEVLTIEKARRIKIIGGLSCTALQYAA